MTDIVRYEPQHTQSSLELAPQAWKLAEKIADTDFVPTALRRRPEAVLACILTGHEAGLSPMQSLAKIHVIEGRPAMAAELMRALVLSHGHELDYEEVTSTRVTAAGRRQGREKWTRVTWTMDDAKRAGIDGKQNWRKWPRAMLTARATSELCRLVFADVLAGISYTTEELEDGIEGFEPAPELTTAATSTPTKKTAAARRRATRVEEPAEPVEVVAPPAGEVPGLPEAPEDDDDIVDADVIDIVEDQDEPEPEAPDLAEPEPEAPAEPEEDWPTGEWESGDFPIDPAEQAKRYTGPQIIAIKLAELYGIKGSTAEARAQRLERIGAILGREVASSKDLTSAEVQSVIKALEQAIADNVNGPEPDEPQDAPQNEPDPAPVSPVEDEPAIPVPPPTEPVVEHTASPEKWTGDEWRAFLAKRKVKVTETMREAQRLAALLDPKPSVATLDDLADQGVAVDLVGWVEDTALGRK